jgi:hypothetical protein
MNENQLIGGITRDTIIHRIFPRFRLESLFVSRQLTLVRPSLWDDPCENFLFHLDLTDSFTGRPVGIEGLRRSLYGQCWTQAPDSDALWRIYSSDHTAIRVTTTVGKLIDALWDSGDRFASLRYFVGAVQYLSQDQFSETFADPQGCFYAITDTSGRPQIETLLLKRDSFDHEREVRVIFHEPDSSIDHRDTWSRQIDPNSLFGSICFDPRLTLSCCTTETNRWKTTYGFTGDITRSTLYDVPLPRKLTI